MRPIGYMTIDMIPRTMEAMDMPTYLGAGAATYGG